MKRKRISYIGFFLIMVICFLGMISCGESDCSITRRPASRFVFKDSATGLDIAFDSLNVYTLLNETPPRESFLFEKLTNVNYVSLPLNYTSETTIFILEYLSPNTRYRDTIWVDHTNIPTFISMDCGRDMFFHIEDFRSTSNELDDIRLTNPDIRDHEKENFQIFYPVTEE